MPVSALSLTPIYVNCLETLLKVVYPALQNLKFVVFLSDIMLTETQFLTFSPVLQKLSLNFLSLLNLIANLANIIQISFEL